MNKTYHTVRLNITDTTGASDIYIIGKPTTYDLAKLELDQLYSDLGLELGEAWIEDQESNRVD